MPENGREILPDSQNREQLMQALESVLASRTFAEVFRLKNFLQYVVLESIDGRSERLKGFVIACEVFGKEDPSDAQTTTVVRVEAGRLRRRLKDYYDSEGAGDPIRISIPKGGYAPVFSLAGSSKMVDKSPEIPHRQQFIGQKPLLWLVVAAVAVISFYYAWNLDKTTEPLTPAISNDKPAIAVMPFENLTGSAEGDAVARSFTEDIVIDLGSVASIDVISVSSVWSFTEPNISPRAIGTELGAGYILRGSIRELHPDLSITARLFDTKTGRQLLAERYEGTVENSTNQQTVLAQKVVSALSVNLEDNREQVFGKRFTDNREAWQLYKQAMNLANPPSDPGRLELSQEIFEKVIAMDPAFPGGYAGSAYTRAFIIFFGHSINPETDRQKALELASKAQELNPAFGLTFSALAFLNLSNGQFEEALTFSRQAIEIQPNDAYVSAYHGFIKGANGDFEGGVPFAKRALRLDPLNARTPYLNILGVLNYFAGNYEDARDNFLKNKERGGPGGAGPVRFLAASYSKLGQTALAESVLRQSDQLSPGSDQWKEWLLRSFSDPAIPLRVLDEVEHIRVHSRG